MVKEILQVSGEAQVNLVRNKVKVAYDVNIKIGITIGTEHSQVLL